MITAGKGITYNDELFGYRLQDGISLRLGPSESVVIG